jgi:hypothetical protein
VARRCSKIGVAFRRICGKPASVRTQYPSDVPERNRVTPMGDIVAIPLRGAWTGNRGILHAGHEIVRFHASDLWITCALEFRGRWREQWLPHRWTYLYFHDEAVSFAAGHRPCAECRRESYRAYQAAWAGGLGTGLPSAARMNRQLHAERIVRGSHRRRLHAASWADLPDGAFVLLGTPGTPGATGVPAIVAGDELITWTYDGYGTRRRRPRYGAARLITPPATVAALRDGYPVQIDPAARRLRRGARNRPSDPGPKVRVSGRCYRREPQRPYGEPSVTGPATPDRRSG